MSAAKVCAFCKGPAGGNFTIHRDGFGEGPEVDLCDEHGSNPEPREVDIWARIGQSPDCLACEGEIHSYDARQGSFHEWCT